MDQRSTPPIGLRLRMGRLGRVRLVHGRSLEGTLSFLVVGTAAALGTLALWDPEAPWPEVRELARQSESEGYRLVARLTVYPPYLRTPERWIAEKPRGACLALCDADGLLRDSTWKAGAPGKGVLPPRDSLARDGEVAAILDRCAAGRPPSKRELLTLFGARGGDFHDVVEVADALRREQVGDAVSFVVNRNINYTNVCQYACSFCAFSKGSAAQDGREKPYDIDGRELARRSLEAWELGATEVCLQGGIHPAYSGETYLSIVGTIRRLLPEIHIHAFSPLEVMHGAQTLGVSLCEFLQALKDAGLSTLPGTAAEILVDEVRARICPDKLTTNQWLEVMRTAHGLGLKTTATMMFGHVESPADWAQHLVLLRRLQKETGGFTEFVPLPFVAQGAPIARRGGSRSGPTLREAVLMHAVARLALGHTLPNIQASWVKMGREHALDCLGAGANDLGGTLFNESITRAAGAAHGQVWPAGALAAAIEDLGRPARVRSTDYSDADRSRANLALSSNGVVSQILNLPAAREPRAKAVGPG